MQQLDHDMDDLLRKAAESYPLKTERGDWDKMAAKLAFTPVVREVKSRKDKRFFGLLLMAMLLALFLAGLYQFNSSNKKKATTGLPAAGANRKSAAGDNDTHLLPPATGSNSMGLVHPDSVVEKQPIQSMPLQQSTDGTVNNSDLKKSGASNYSVVSSKKHLASMATDKGSVASPGASRVLKLSNRALSPGDHPKTSSEKKLAIVETVESSLAKGERTLGSTAGDYPVTPSESLTPGRLLAPAEVKSLPAGLRPIIYEPLLKTPPVVITRRLPGIGSSFYIGATGGPQFSKIGSQKKTGMGVDGGLLVGYQFNSIWSLESGLIIGRDNYYSDGRYFSMTKLASVMPNGLEILSVDGMTKHLEIPLVARYNVRLHRQSKIFFTGGILSDLYLQERNHYQTMLNGMKDNQMGLYNENHAVIASQLRLSLGYEHTLGRSGGIRIEPYKNIPLQRTGMGNMSMFRSGFNIALVHYFKK